MSSNPIRLYNTLSGKKEDFVPSNDGTVRVYLCGPTVYDYIHIGNARSAVAFDAIVRFLRSQAKVTFVRNFTDVDDKIIRRSNELNEPWQQLTERFAQAYIEDMAALGCDTPDHMPRVTEHMDGIIEMVSELVNKGSAYAVDGSVYFAVRAFDGYGKLSKRNLEDLEAGARVEIDERKRDPMDFALWKAAKPNEPSWDSPWGQGRPGWHIECSVMSAKLLGETFDIHGGGKDLIFPHHENEIAQSEACHGCTFARYWLHNGFVSIDDEKMSKSLGNFFTVREVLERYHPQVVRLFLLSTHYRSPINFSDKALDDATDRVRYIYETMLRLEAAVTEGSEEGAVRKNSATSIHARFVSAMSDDFNTAQAIAELSEGFRLVNDVLDHPGSDAESDARTLRVLHRELSQSCVMLNLFSGDKAATLKEIEGLRAKGKALQPDDIDALVQARVQARIDKNWAEADRIREQLDGAGIIVKDDPKKGTTWEYGR